MIKFKTPVRISKVLKENLLFVATGCVFDLQNISALGSIKSGDLFPNGLFLFDLNKLSVGIGTTVLWKYDLMLECPYEVSFDPHLIGKMRFVISTRNAVYLFEVDSKYKTTVQEIVRVPDIKQLGLIHATILRDSTHNPWVVVTLNQNEIIIMQPDPTKESKTGRYSWKVFGRFYQDNLVYPILSVESSSQNFDIDECLAMEKSPQKNDEEPSHFDGYFVIHTRKLVVIFAFDHSQLKWGVFREISTEGSKFAIRMASTDHLNVYLVCQSTQIDQNIWNTLKSSNSSSIPQFLFETEVQVIPLGRKFYESTVSWSFNVDLPLIERCNFINIGEVLSREPTRDEERRLAFYFLKNDNSTPCSVYKLEHVTNLQKFKMKRVFDTKIDTIGSITNCSGIAQCDWGGLIETITAISTDRGYVYYQTRRTLGVVTFLILIAFMFVFSFSMIIKFIVPNF